MIKEITTLCNKIWEMEDWPRDWKKFIFYGMRELLNNIVGIAHEQDIT